MDQPPELAKQWNGRIYGTNTGNVSLSLEKAGADIEGELRLLDDASGPVVFSVKGSWDGTVLTSEANATQVPPNVQVGLVKMTGHIGPDGRLVGQWTSAVGTGGSFALHPHSYVEATPGADAGGHAGDAAGSADQTHTSDAPEQVYIVQRRVGAVRLFREDVEQLVAIMLSDFQANRLAITFKPSAGPLQRTVWSDDFLKDPGTDRTGYLKLAISEPAQRGMMRSAVVELGYLFNEMTVQGPDRSWTTGMAETIRAFLEQKQSTLATQFRLHNVSAVQVGLLVLLVFMMGMRSLSARFALMGIAVLAVVAVAAFHARFVPNTMVYLTKKPPNAVQRFWPAWASWIAGIIAALIVAFAGRLIEQGMKQPEAQKPAANAPLQRSTPTPPAIARTVQ